MYDSERLSSCQDTVCCMQGGLYRRWPQQSMHLQRPSFLMMLQMGVNWADTEFRDLKTLQCSPSTGVRMALMKARGRPGGGALARESCSNGRAYGKEQKSMCNRGERHRVFSCNPRAQAVQVRGVGGWGTPSQPLPAPLLCILSVTFQNSS